jgi:putative hemolysin
MSKKVTFIKFLFVGAALLVAGCGTPTGDVTEEPAPGMPNPASVYCEEEGGTLEVRQSQDGEYGVCIFGDGSECDEWAFFRGECKPGDSTIAPAPEHYPRYINEQYGFSLDPSPDYAIEGWDNYTLFKRSGYVLFVGYKWADEEVGPFRTGVPAGDWVDGGTAELLGQEIPRSLLVYEGKVKAVFYGSMIEVGNLNLSMWLETDQGESVAYEDIDIPAEIQGEADQIVGSFALTSGEVPEVKAQPIEASGAPVDPYEGWETYTNDVYGFTFRYPASWTLEEVPAEDTPGEGGLHGNSVQLHQGSLMLYIGYRWATEDVLLGGTGLPAGDLESRGTVTFLGTELEKTVLVYEGKVKGMYYGVTEVGDLVFAIRLDDFSLIDYGDVDIPDATQIEVNEILGSFGLTG